MSSVIALALQVGPNPQAGGFPGIPEELLDRPPRPGEDQLISSPESQWLAECLGFLPEEAARAHTLAQLKRNESSGAQRVLANHCLGLAATELGRWEEASSAFLAAFDETPEDERRARARFALMAGNAMLAGGDANGANLNFRLARIEADLAASATLQAMATTDLARSLVASNMPEQALSELEEATRIDPNNAEAWLLRATLLRRLDRLDEAQTAIERAGALAPMEVQIGLEAGVIAVLSGRDEAARQSWQSVIDIQPDSLAAQTARDYLDQLGPEPEEAPL